MIRDRTEILREALRLTSAERNNTYGSPHINLACAASLKAVFWTYAKIDRTRVFTGAEREALDMVFTKLSRIACGKPHLDNYIDGSAYLAIAGEMMDRYLAGEAAEAAEKQGKEENADDIPL